jgi:hypothetical protein
MVPASSFVRASRARVVFQYPEDRVRVTEFAQAFAAIARARRRCSSARDRRKSRTAPRQRGHRGSFQFGEAFRRKDVCVGDLPRADVHTSDRFSIGRSSRPNHRLEPAASAGAGATLPQGPFGNPGPGECRCLYGTERDVAAGDGDHDRAGTATVTGRVDLARKPPGNVLSDLQTGPDAQRALRSLNV